MITEERQSYLNNLVGLVAGAGDKYYFGMSKENFDNCIDGNEEGFNN